MSRPDAAQPSRLLLVNQTVGPLFMGVVAAARQRGPVSLMLGSSTVPLPAGVERLAGLPYRRSPGWCRLLTWAGFTVQLALRLLLERLAALAGRGRYQRLLVVSNPPLAPLLAPLAGRPYALLLYDLYPEVLEQLGLGHHHPIPALWRFLNRLVYARAEVVITLSAGMAEALRPCFHGSESWRRRVRVVPPWADTSLIRPVPPENNLVRRALGLADRFVVLYSGNLGLTHPLEPLLEAAAHLGAGGHAAIELLLIGDGPKRASLQQLARRLQLERLRLLDPLPIEQVSHSYSAASLAVVCLDGPAAQASLPSKTFTALATGTPILALAPPGSALAALVDRHGCGVVVPPDAGAARQIASLLETLAADPQRCRRMAERALQASAAYGPDNANQLIECWLGSAPDWAPS